jgi:hypothetical protein
VSKKREVARTAGIGGPADPDGEFDRATGLKRGPVFTFSAGSSARTSIWRVGWKDKSAAICPEEDVG